MTPPILSIDKAQLLAAKDGVFSEGINHQHWLQSFIRHFRGKLPASLSIVDGYYAESHGGSELQTEVTEPADTNNSHCLTGAEPSRRSLQ
ncbi:hypothetical protein COL922a_005833 [Colletotrichum nupharicola]|nr:hypothetical protein COL922a_005833 [Colletotrichum nupharicola]